MSVGQMMQAKLRKTPEIVLFYPAPLISSYQKDSNIIPSKKDHTAFIEDSNAKLLAKKYLVSVQNSGWFEYL